MEIGQQFGPSWLDHTVDGSWNQVNFFDPGL